MFDIIRNTDHPSKLAIVAALSLVFAGFAHGQTPAPLGSSSPAADAEWTALSPVDLEELIGPIALYPDDLVAIVLPASTYPLQIVQASRYLAERDGNANLQPDESWDDSVVALLNYPEVLALLNDDLDWTYALGEAVVYQQGDLLNAIQSFRDRAYAAGNLATDERQVIATEDDGAITISPADPEVIYVPYYDPARVVVHSYVPAYYYYPYAYPVYYYPYPAGYSFGSGFFWGVTTAFLISWHDDYLHVRHHSRFGHPYYGYSYYTPWYARTNLYVNVNHYGSYDRWRPSYRHGARPRHPSSYSRLKDTTVVRTPAERRIRSGWVSDQRDDGRSIQPRRGATTGGGLDDGRARRIRSGRYDANATGAGSNSTADTGVANGNRRGRGPSAAAPATTDNRLSRSRTARVETRGDTRPARSRPDSANDSGRFQNRSSGMTANGRAAPQRDSSSAARGQQAGSVTATRTPKRNVSPTFGRIAPERGANPAARGVPVNPPTSRAAPRAPAQALGRSAPAQRAPGMARPSGNREQPMSRPNVQHQAQNPPAAAGGGRSDAGRAPQARQNGAARSQPRGEARQNGRPSGGAGKNRRAK